MSEISQTHSQKDRLIEGLKRPGHAEDVELMADFTAWYCKAKHKNRTKMPVDLVTYELNNTPVKKRALLCTECAEFVQYSEKRTAFCKQDPKPFCANCSIKCYMSKMQDYSRQVMRYSGPRSLFSRHAIAALRHILKQNER